MEKIKNNLGYVVAMSIIATTITIGLSISNVYPTHAEVDAKISACNSRVDNMDKKLDMIYDIVKRLEDRMIYHVTK